MGLGLHLPIFTRINTELANIGYNCIIYIMIDFDLPWSKWLHLQSIEINGDKPEYLSKSTRILAKD